MADSRHPWRQEKGWRHLGRVKTPTNMGTPAVDAKVLHPLRKKQGGNHFACTEKGDTLEVGEEVKERGWAHSGAGETTKHSGDIREKEKEKEN